MKRAIDHFAGMALVAFVAIIPLLAGCKQNKPTTAAAATSAPAPATLYLSQAQPKLQTIKVFVGPEELITELALKPHEMATGMMFRTNMAENEAMLFAFSQPLRASFYMRNTRVPLSAAYIDPDGVIQEIHDLQPFEERPVEAASENIQFVLEVPQGWFKRHNVSTGTVTRTQYGTLRQSFSFSRVQ